MATISNYEILETISDNYKKIVYRGKDTLSRENVILKVLKSEFSTHEEVMRFKREYKILAELSGSIEGVVKPLKLEEQNGMFVMVLEDTRGQSLKMTMAVEKPELNTLLRLVVKVVDILGAIHEKSVIHKDIKPSNIIWNKETDVVKVIDFDLAVKLPKEKQEFQNSGLLEGSLFYISPEQTGRMNRNIDYRTDFYSLGVVLYEMATGVKPYESEDVLEQIYSIIAKEAVPPFKLTGGKVSRPLSDMIMKLMEKSPENRYRSSYGIKADLQKCLSGMGDFEIGREDKLNIFQIPQKIYGREAELESLADSFAKSIKGHPQIMLVSGEAGIGKTALVNELHLHISREKGLFAEGKFDQYNRNIPYSAIIQAFKKLLNQLLSSPGEDIKNIEKALKKALDRNGALITKILPELEKLIGVQPEIGHLNPAEETNRFFLTFINFIEGITNNEKPLVLFLDDVQWADSSSLQLVEKLILSNNLRKLFIVCAYRQNEIQKYHSFTASIGEIEKSREVGRIYLNSLTVRDVENLIADTLCTGRERVGELSEIIYGRTKGNPFFVNEVVKDLHKNRLIFFNERNGRWNWEIDKIRDLNINDNVVEFLMMKMKNLPHGVQEILKLSAAIGSRFDFKMLLLIGGKDRRDIAGALIKAVDEDVILPADRNYHILYNLLEENEGEARDINIDFIFQHDRIQQAFYQMIDKEMGKRLHLKIGRLLLANLPAEEIEEKIVDIAAHINKGIEFVHARDEINKAVEVNLKAAKKAKAVFGYGPAFLLLETAKNLLAENAWKEDGQQTWEIYELYSECGYLTHNTEAADKACAVLLENTGSGFEAARIYEMQANHYTYLGMMKESIEAGKKGLKNLGINIPDKVGMASVLLELTKVKLHLKGRTIEEIFEVPEIKDEKIKLIMRLLINFIPPAYISGETNLFALAVLKKANLTLKHGNCAESAAAFIGYSILLSGLGDINGAFAFGRLGIRLNDKFNDLQWRGSVHVLYTLFCHAWKEPWDTLQDWFKKAIDSSLKTGDLLYLAHACYYINLWNPTMDIGTNLQESGKYIAMIENTRYKEALATARLARQKFLNLAGELEDRFSFDGEAFSEAAYINQLETAKYYSGIAIYHIYKIELLFTYEDYKGTLEYIEKAYKIISTLAGSAFMEEFSLYSFLSLAYGYKDLNVHEKIKARARMRKEYRRVKKWAKHCPENFLQHELLMKAEWARISGRNEMAEKYYDLAIETSEKGNFIRYKALTNELASKFYHDRNLKELAAYLFRQALYYYSVWGARGKVEHLEKSYPDLVKKINKKEFIPGKTITESTESIDLNSIILASQAISKEIELDSLLEALMEIVIKNAGAQRGCIMMKSSSNLLVEGEYKPEEDKIDVLIHQASEFENLPKAIIGYVEDSKENLIYNDAFSESQFVNDAYIIKFKPKSLVCMPLINQNKITAIIYLENKLVAGVFTKERMKIINLLSREMVFSLENASLYSDLERSEEKYRELVNNMLDGIFIIQDKKYKYVNAAMAQMVGYKIEDMLGRPFEDFIHPRDRERILAYHLSRINHEKAPGEYEVRLLHRNRRKEVIVIQKVTVVNYLDRPAVHGTVKDITGRKKAEEELRKHKEHLEELVAERTKELEYNNEELNKYIKLIEKISITDELTGLYNRRYFNDIFLREVNRAARDKGHLTCIMIDIDYYKKYNDTYGHYEGDNVLRKLGYVIREHTKRASDYAFRLGGEEFCVLVSGLDAGQSFEFAEGIRKSVKALKIEHKMSTVGKYLTVSIGVAVARVEGMNEEDVYKLADDALYNAKANGRNRVTLLEK